MAGVRQKIPVDLRVGTKNLDFPSCLRNKSAKAFIYRGENESESYVKMVPAHPQEEGLGY